MKLVWQLIGAICIVSGVCLVLGKVYPVEAKPQVTYPVTLDELFDVVTKDGKTYKSVKINLSHLGCFVIKAETYFYIPIENIKSITEVKNASENECNNGGNIQRQPKDR